MSVSLTEQGCRTSDRDVRKRGKTTFDTRVVTPARRPTAADYERVAELFAALFPPPPPEEDAR
jgi:hypothetical protein